MSDPLIITLGVNVDEFNLTIDDVAERAEAVTKEWNSTRVKLLRDMQGAVSNINRVIGLWRQALSIFGQTLDPFFSSLLNMVMSTVGMMFSVATAMATTGVGIPAAAYLTAVAIGLNIATTAKILKDKAESMRYTREAMARTHGLQTSLTNRTPFGVSF